MTRSYHPFVIIHLVIGRYTIQGLLPLARAAAAHHSEAGAPLSRAGLNSAATARAANRRFWFLSALLANIKVPNNTDFLWETLRTLNRPGAGPDKWRSSRRRSARRGSAPHPPKGAFGGFGATPRKRMIFCIQAPESGIDISNMTTSHSHIGRRGRCCHPNRHRLPYTTQSTRDARCTAGRDGSTTGAHPHRGAAAEGSEHGGLVRAAVDEPERHLQGSARKGH